MHAKNLEKSKSGFNSNHQLFAKKVKKSSFEVSYIYEG